ncbi:MAG: thiamine-phosphate kinase [Alphaproteobacteria bacterium]|nr:thiamine-phosphate kinase [Alphaproteobacteria bacterium]
MDEFGIIARHFAPLATTPGAFGLKDDAAAIAARPGFDLIVTTDQIAEGTDFFAQDPPASIAQKALRVNLSDLAAKGAVADCYLLVLALPPGATEEWLAQFAAGLGADQQRYGISLLGGDTSATTGPLTVTVTAFGFVPQGRMVTRGGAKPGDAIYVTGSIGDSAGGLAILKREPHALNQAQRDHLVARYHTPEPPIDFGKRLAGLATASVDISDGLIADIGHLAAASGVAVAVDAEAVPLSDALRALWGTDAILRAATSGDDYQIAFSASPARDGDIRAAAAQAGIAVTRIGAVAAGEGVTLHHQGRLLPVARPGYRHF